MTMELYWGSGSPYAWRVMLALEYKQISYASHMLSFAQNELRSPAYLALNPRGRVPTLRDGQIVISESLAILVYLDGQVPEPSIFGHSPADAGRIFQAISEYSSYVDLAVEAFIIPLYFGQAETRAAEVKAAAGTLYKELAILEHTLQSRHYLVGEALSAADFVWYPHVKSIERAASKDAAKAFDFALLPFERTYPAIHAWAQRVEQMPGYDRTYPPHWKQ